MRVVGQFGGQRFAKEAIDQQQFVDQAQAIERHVAEAASDAVANQQGAGQHGRRGGHAECHGHIDFPVVDQASNCQTQEIHGRVAH